MTVVHVPHHRMLSTALRTAFEAAGCRFLEQHVDARDGTPVTAETPAECCVAMYSVHAPDGSYLNDAVLDVEHLRRLARHGIFAPERAHPACGSAQIGRATAGPHVGSWIAWGRPAGVWRAFRTGSTITREDIGYIPATQDELYTSWTDPDKSHHATFVMHDVIRTPPGSAWTGVCVRRHMHRTIGTDAAGHPVQVDAPDMWIDKPCGRGEWTARTDADARQMAVDYANAIT